VHDQLPIGRRFRMPNLLDDVTRASLRSVVDTSTSGRRRCANWLTANAVPNGSGERFCIAPGRPMLNG
jgi:hypothetical protein